MLIKVSLLASLYFLFGCSTPLQTQHLYKTPINDIELTKNIANVPFYSQKAFYCGPTTLAEIFQYHGVKKTPDEIAPQLFIPQRKGSLQLEMIAAIRQQGFLAYTEQGSLKHLIKLINHDIPVIVLQNLGLSWYPLWHYALVKGYDLNRKEFILHSADIKDRRVSMAVFERTWQRANFWYVTALPPKQDISELDPFTYISAAQDLITLGSIGNALPHLKHAVAQWPRNWLSYFLLANHYFEQSQTRNITEHNSKKNRLYLTQAINWFEQGLPYGETQSVYLNNYAYALFKAQDYRRAMLVIEQALIIAPTDQDVIDTKEEIEQELNEQH